MIMPTRLLPTNSKLSRWFATITPNFFKWWYNPHTDTIYQRSSSTIMKKYMCMEYNRRKIYVGRGNERVNIAHLQICDVYPMKHLEDHVLLLNATDFDNAEVPQHGPITKTNCSFREYLDKHLEEEQWVLSNITFIGDERDIIQSLGCGTIRAVSDGSCDFESGIGTSGWCIIGGNAAIRGVNLSLIHI